MTWHTGPDGDPQDRLGPREPGPEATGPRADMPVIGPGRDLAPRPDTSPAGHRGGQASEPFLSALLGDLKRSGRWRVGRSTRFMLILGDALLDLREAEFETPTVELWVFSFGGDVRLVVPPGMQVEVRGSLLLGDQDIEAATAGGDGRRVVLNLKGGLGDVKVKAFEVGEKIPRKWRWF